MSKSSTLSKGTSADSFQTLHQALSRLDWIEHVSGNEFKVNIAAILLADGPIPKGGQVVFRDPRTIILNQGGQHRHVQGLSPEEMQDLREMIRTGGMIEPLLLRWVSGSDNDQMLDPFGVSSAVELAGILSVQLVNGNRRLRNIKKLIADKATCFDPNTRQMVPAEVLYSKVRCNIMVMDVQSAYKYAFSMNEGVPIGEAADASNVRQWRSFGWDDQAIMAVTSKGEKWLKVMDTLSKLDEQTFKALAEKRITASLAKHLARIPDLNERLEQLSKVQDSAINRVTMARQKLGQMLNQTNDLEEIALAGLKDATTTGDGEVAAQAQAKITKMQERRRRLTDSANALGPSKRATVRDMSVPRAVSRPKIKNDWHGVLTELIQSADFPKDEIDYDDAVLASQIIKTILGEQKSSEPTGVLEILKTHRLFKDSN